MSLKPQPDFGDLYTIPEFMDMVQEGVVSDCDGTGYFATSDKLSDISARPSTLRLSRSTEPYTGEFTHIMWFNK